MSLDTSASNLTAAVNELVGDIGDINTDIGSTTLPTTATTLTGAIAEIFNRFDKNLPATEYSDLDAFNAQYQQIIKWNGETLNTPYKTGLTQSTAGIAISYSNSSDGNYAVQLALPSGSTVAYVRAKNGGTWGSWKAIGGGGAVYLTSVPCLVGTGNFIDYHNSKITASHAVASCVFANPKAVPNDVTWTTSTGYLTVNGTCYTSTTADIILVEYD